MSRNIYDPATDTLTPIAGCNGMDSNFSSTSQNALKNSVITNAMGALSSLSTSNKSSLVNAINEVNTKSINNQGNFAYINTNSTTASKAYTSGEQFILDGVLRRAKTAIASGATLTLNSNYENAPSVTSQISNLSTDINGKATGSICYHITSTAHPNVAVNLICNGNMSTTFLLFSDMFGNAFITHFALNSPPSSITEITNNAFSLTWLNKPSNNVSVFLAAQGSDTRIKLTYNGGSGTPVISITQLDNSSNTVIKSYSFAQS